MHSHGHLEGLPIPPVDPSPEPPIRTSHHALVLFPETGPMLDQLTADVEHARERVWIETYIYRHDRLARSFAEVMIRAARRGVDVRLLYDPLGCNKTDPRFFEWLRQQGVNVRAYRPADVVLRSGNYWPRDHSRIVVVDGSGYTGGAAWGDEWLPRSRGGHGWHDVCSRIEGPCVQDFAHAFQRRWAEAAGEIHPPGAIATGKKYPDVEFVADTPGPQHPVFERHRERIRRARFRVWLENAYFFPPIGLLEDLYAAAARGVDVKLILPCETDLPIMKHAARAEYEDWLEHGLQLFEYCPAVLHAKFGLVDDDWATVGTFNANVASLRYANEANLFVYDRRFVARVAELFENDLSGCTPLTPQSLRARPLIHRVGDLLANNAITLFETGRAATRRSNEP